jgi:hypothetical protein
MEATKVITNTPPRSARSVSAAATAPARKSSYRPVRQQRNSSPMARRATTTRSAPSMGVAAASTRMGARDVGTSQGRRAAAFLAARLGGAREGRAALAARRWYCRGGRTGRKRSSLGALSDARGGIMSSCCSMPPAAVAHRHAAALPCRPAAAQQGDTLPGRSTASRGDCGGDARGRQRHSWFADSRTDRGPLAGRSSDQRRSRAPRSESRSPSARSKAVVPLAPAVDDTRTLASAPMRSNDHCRVSINSSVCLPPGPRGGPLIRCAQPKSRR